MKKKNLLITGLIFTVMVLSQLALHASFVWADPQEIVLSSYDPETIGGPTSSVWLQKIHPSQTLWKSACGQTFQFYSGGNYMVTKTMFYLSKAGSPNGTAYAYLYEVSGGIPIGEPLSTSEPIDVTTISSGWAWNTFNFNQSQQYKVHAGIKYAIVFVNPTENSNVSSANYVHMRYDPSYPTHDGNMVYFHSDAWHESYPPTNSDVLFYIYGKEGGSAGGQDPQPPWLKVRWDAICEHLKNKVGSPLWQMGATLNSKLQVVVPALGKLAIFMLFLCGVWIAFVRDKTKGKQ